MSKEGAETKDGREMFAEARGKIAMLRRSGILVDLNAKFRLFKKLDRVDIFEL